MSQLIMFMHPLQKAIEQEMLARLALVALQPKSILLLGNMAGLAEHYPNAEIMTTATQPGSVDMIISTPSHADIEQQLPHWKHLLRPEGLLMFATYGPNSLMELATPENALPRFTDMHNLGDALLQVGFADPVMDVEHFEIKYQNKAQLLDDLKAMEVIIAHLETLSLTYEIVYGHAWCPEKTADFLADSSGVVNIPLAALRARLQK